MPESKKVAGLALVAYGLAQIYQFQQLGKLFRLNLLYYLIVVATGLVFCALSEVRVNDRQEKKSRAENKEKVRMEK